MRETTIAMAPLRALQRLHPTLKAALASYTEIGITYPISNERKKRQGTNSRRVNIEQYGWELLKALRIVIKASPMLCAERERRRSISVLFSN